MSYFERHYQGNAFPLSKALEALYPELPFALLSKLIRQKDVFLNGTRVKDGVVRDGDTVNLYCTPGMIGLRVLYRSADVLALYKPKGVPSDGEYSFASLVRYVYPEALLMHRLDTNTDGVLLFARNQHAYGILYDGMKGHEITKYYRAFVYGKVTPRTQTIKGYLFKDAKAGKVFIYDAPRPGAVSVRCEVSVAGYDGACTHVEVEITGGKTHQIRALLAHSGHFILGDGKYGDDRINKQMGIKRLALTSYMVRFHFEKDVLRLNDVTISLD